MPGYGLVQLISNSQDLFLTSNPHITFFKTVYRRHTNFSIDPIKQYFIGTPDFNQDVSCVIDKAGDLMSKIYIKIGLPKVNLIKNSSKWNLDKIAAKDLFDKIKQYYELVINYTDLNISLARKLHIFNMNGGNYMVSDILRSIVQNEPDLISNISISKQNLDTYICNSDIILDEKEKFTIRQMLNTFDVVLIAQSHNFNDHSILKKYLQNSFYFLIRNYYLKVYELYVKAEKDWINFENNKYLERYKFAWVEEIGHVILENIEIQIGNKVIDRHTSEWMIIHNKLYTFEHHLNNYNKMIGNVEELTIFDDKIKNEYVLTIPLQFWFCRHTGLAVPLTSLKYNDILINTKFRSLDQLCMYEIDDIDSGIANIQSIYKINMNYAYLYVDYIYLDNEERKRFAESSHEYLIEQVQYEEFDTKEIGELGLELAISTKFNHSTKFIVWYAQPLNQKLSLNNFGINENKTGHTMKTSSLKINSYNRVQDDLDIKYYNCYHPYLYFNRGPPDGLNVYSFGIMPTKIQPAGSINMSRIDDFSLEIIFDKTFIDKIKNSYTGIHIGIYALSYNILRIYSGMAGLAFE